MTTDPAGPVGPILGIDFSPDCVFQGGLYVRPGTHDTRFVLRERSTYKRRLVRFAEENGGPGDLVLLDLGANIGSVSALAVDLGWKQAVAVEPDPHNLPVLRMNATAYPGITVEPLMVTDTEHSGYASFYTAGYAKGAFSTSTPENSRASHYAAVTVSTASLGDLLARHQPDLLKCDIEGGEYDIVHTLSTLHEYPQVKELIIEIHLWPGEHMRTKAVELYGILCRNWIPDFKVFKQPKPLARAVQDRDAEGWDNWWSTATEGLFTFTRRPARSA